MPESSDEAPGYTRRTPFRATAKLCPKCLNPLQKGSELGGWLVTQDYYCTRCGYMGPVYIEKDINEETLKEVAEADKRGEKR